MMKILKNKLLKVERVIFYTLLWLPYTLNAQEVKTLLSPDKTLSVAVSLKEKIYYTVMFKGERVLEASPLTLTLENVVLGANPKVIETKLTTVDQMIQTVWGSRKNIRDQYNLLSIDFEGGFSVEFRAYNNGMAYRFVTRLKEKQVIVRNEEVGFRFNFGVSAWMLDSRSYETNYKKEPLDVQAIQDFKNSKSKVYLPIVVQSTPRVKVLISEAGLYDYPGLFLDRGNDYENFLNGTFEKYALTTKTGGFSNYSQLADKEAEYIAVTSGTREYPWRLLVISDDDRTFADCDLVYQLSRPSELKETDWIKPGKVAWEWWHDYVVEGQNFKGGVNTQTYLYHIDFAAKYGLEYILIDWLWTDKYDLTVFNPDVDLKKITDYGLSKGIKVIVWCPAHTLHRQMNKALDLFAANGVAGVKADFFGREDQTGIRMYEEIARATAAHKMLIDFHGAAKPTGLSRTYPNVINYEAVAGNEWNKLSADKVTIGHRIILPFTRGLQGPMDFTPGGMRNVQSGHKLRMTLPEVHGTRSSEMAMFVLYNEPLKMLCDAPSVYDREPEIWILSTDKSGAMYGCLDIAEAINNQTINNISDSDNRPYLERRGLKFNIPFDLRTPSYSDLSDAFQQNITVMWDMDFWKQQFDEMARNRYNVISLWSLNPFPSLVKVPEFPDVALNDVWRTTAKLENVYPTDGTGNLNQELLENHEIVKKITINEKIDFWRKVMEYARDRGIEVYLFTWNIFTFGENGKYGIDNDRSNDKTIAYFRASVREMVLTYPLLAGFGITAGENMGGKNELYTNEQWLWKTYGEGIRDALQKQPGRKIRLIHRFHQTGLTEIMDEFREYPGIMDLSIKYSIAHMYSITNPPFARGAFELLPSNRHTWLTVRNDDIYSFRWGNPDYARHYLLNIPSPEKVAGYYMGSDGYCLGREFLGKDNAMPRPLVIEKQWYSYMLWGRLSYNPHLSDELFLQTLESRFPAAPGRILMNAWSAASMVFPWTTRLLWGDIDLKWFPEACISIPSYKGFYTVKDFMEVEPMARSNIQNILDWAQNYKFNKTSNLLSPLAVADSISKYSRLAMIYLHQMMPGDPGSSVEFDQTLGDIEAFATIGFYYKEKILGACSLALFNFYGLQQDKEDAVDHLTKAKEYWAKYAAIYDSKYKPALYNRIGYVNIPLLLEKTVKDIEIASYWKPGSIKEYTVKTRTEVPFSK